ncbi:hypothetical protein [Shimazuella alba]|uniref:Uncharacterized protein n=1 Tax=Shimazuella alba TaxID=2690964 RepID=A0A6I4VS69_9BACL|nr:hypothetical protein [Shimazuella alba]MXQ52756.1 hypothetical protein [Shimazuella alba]
MSPIVIETGYTECHGEGTKYEKSAGKHKLTVFACNIGGPPDDTPIQFKVFINYDGRKLEKPGYKPWKWTSPCKSFQVICKVKI